MSSLVVSAINFLLRRLPRSYPWISRLFYSRQQQRQLARAIADVQSIGKVHQFLKLAQTYQERGEWSHALAVYHQALNKEPNNPTALWGAATIELSNRNLQQTCILLQILIKANPDYRYGEASLTYCQVLFELGDFNAAEHQLNNHLSRWSHPEALLTMAKIRAHMKNASGARQMIETMISNVEGSPPFHYRKHQRHIKAGRRMLRALK